MIGAERFILIGCLLQGALGSNWAVWMPQSIEALSGSCVLIPCRFDIPSAWNSSLAYDSSSVSGQWFRYRIKVFDSRSQSASSLRGKITGDLLQKNCTTVLENLPISYGGYYNFRLEGYLRLTFTQQGVQINIRDSPPKPNITTEKVEVKEGASVSLNCSAGAPCPERPPNLTWTPRLNDSVDQLQENEDRTKSVSSVLTFTASHLHHGQKITCRALYTLQQEDTQKTSEASLTLSVLYMPQISGSGSCSKTAAEISCSCESRGNPSPSMEWHVSGLRVTNSTERVIREEQLGNTGLRSSLTMRQSQGDTPTLLCISTNTLGSSSLQLHLPSPQQHAGLNCNPLFHIIIIGLICLYVLTVGFGIHKYKSKCTWFAETYRKIRGNNKSSLYSDFHVSRLSRRLKGGRDGDTYASLQLPNISPEYDVLQVKNKHQKHTGTTQEENDDYQNPEDGNRPDSGAN